MEYEYGGTLGGYEPVPLTPPPDTAGRQADGAAVLRRRCARPTKRAVLYVHCAGDSFVPPEVADWFVTRGFHFYAADLRGLSAPGREDGNAAAEELGDCFALLDGAVSYMGEIDGIESVVICAHSVGALVAALWCHARRGSQPADALVLVSPDLGARLPWPAWARATRRASAAPRRSAALRAGAQRRLRRGLDIPCPVLVMCPEGEWDVPGGAGGLLAVRALSGGRVTTRLGEHVTWLKLEGGWPGTALPAGPEQWRFFDELGRWLSAYLSWQIRDQLI